MRCITVIALICMGIAGVQSVITESCLDCLKSVEMTVNSATANACQTLNGVQVCGEYNLSEDFYNTCSIPEAGWDWTSCAYDDTCARWCIKLYMQLTEGDCATALGATTADLMCHDYGRIFNGLGTDCADPLNCPYEQSLRGVCYPNPGPCTNPNGCDIVSPCSGA